MTALSAPRIRRFLADPLLTAVVGDRFWYLIPAGGAPLPVLLTPIDTEPTMPRLVALVSGAALPPGTPLIQGQARIAFDGAVEFEGPELPAAALDALAALVVAHADAVPELERLVGARFVRVSRGSRAEVEACLEAGSWGGLARPPVPGTMPETIARLQLLSPGQKAWFWLTDVGPGGLPFLLVSLADEDPDCLLLQQEVAALRSGAEGARSVSGVLLRTESLLTFTTTQPVPDWSGLMQDLLDTWAPVHPELIALAAGPLTYLTGGAVSGFEDTRCAVPDTADNLLDEQAVLQHTPRGGSARFWITDADADGAVRLCMGDDDALAARLARLPPAAGQAAEGTVLLDGDGLASLVPDAPAPWIKDAARRWKAHHAPAWPILGRLRCE